VEDDKQMTVRQLFELARKGMIWRGQSIENKVGPDSTAKLWVAEEDILPGIIAVKSAAMYDTYVKWAITRGLQGKSVLSIIALGRFLKRTFKTVRYDNATYYYINKEMQETPEEKKKRQETYTQKKNKSVKKIT